MMIDFTADWCIACKELEQKTYTDPAVRAEATRFVPVMIDATELSPDVEALFARYRVLGLPCVVFVNSSGQTMDDPRVTGFVPPSRFVELMRQVP